MRLLPGFVAVALNFPWNISESWQARGGSKRVELLPITFHSSGVVGIV